MKHNNLKIGLPFLIQNNSSNLIMKFDSFLGVLLSNLKLTDCLLPTESICFNLNCYYLKKKFQRRCHRKKISAHPYICRTFNKNKYILKISQIRERSARSVAMSRPSRSSLSASTPDSLSDNESSLGGRYTPRKPSYTPSRGFTPGGSKPNSRSGSKPPSRHGSSLSLDSTGKPVKNLNIELKYI